MEKSTEIDSLLSPAGRIMRANYNQLSDAILKFNKLIYNTNLQDDLQLSSLQRSGSNPAGESLQCTLCGFWKHSLDSSWACILPAVEACPECQLVIYCGRLCMEQDIRHHLKLCHAKPFKQPSYSCSHHDLVVSEHKSVKEPHLSTLSNPPFPVYGLLHDLGGLLPASATVTASASPMLGTPSVSSSVLKLLPKHLRCLFPCAYDLRNVFVTVSQIPEKFEGHIVLFINCAEEILAVRDLLILELLRRHGHDGIDTAIALWFSTALTPVQDCLVLKALRRLIGNSVESSNGEPDRLTYKRRFAHTSVSGSFLQAQLCKSLVYLLCAIASTFGKEFDPRIYWERQEDDNDNKDKLAYALPAHAVSWGRYHSNGLSLPFGAWNAHFLRPNRLRYSMSTDYIARYRHDVIYGWNVQQVIASGANCEASSKDLYGCLFFHVRALMENFLKKVRGCHIELRLTQFEPESFAHKLQKSRVKFDRIDACPIAYYHMHHSNELSFTDLELPQDVQQYVCKLKKDVSAHRYPKASTLTNTVSLFGKLLSKNVSKAWPSLLLTASLDWASEAFKNEVANSEEYKRFVSDMKPMPDEEGSQALTSPYRHHTAFLYHLYRSERFPRMMCSMEGHLGKHFSRYVQELKVDEDVMQMTGLERKKKHKIIFPYCIQFVEPRSRNADVVPDLEEEKAQVHYFNLLFSGFSFLEQYQEWGWPDKAEQPSGQSGLMYNDNLHVTELEHDALQSLKLSGASCEEEDQTTSDLECEQVVVSALLELQHHEKRPRAVAGTLPPDLNYVQALPDGLHPDTSDQLSYEDQPTKDDVHATEHDAALSQLQDLELSGASGKMVDQTTSSLETNEPTLIQLVPKEQIAETGNLLPQHNEKPKDEANILPPDPNLEQASPECERPIHEHTSAHSSAEDQPTLDEVHVTKDDALNQLKNLESTSGVSVEMVDKTTVTSLKTLEPTSIQMEAKELIQTEPKEMTADSLVLQHNEELKNATNIILPPDSHHVQAPPDRPHTETSGHSSGGDQPTKDQSVLATDQQGLSQLQNPALSMASTLGQIVDQPTIPSLESQEPTLSQVTEHEEEFDMTLPLQPDENPETVPADVPPPDRNQLQAHDVFAMDQQEALGQLQNPELSVASTSGQMVDQTTMQSLESQEPTLSQVMELEEECAVTLPLQPDENPVTAADIPPPDPNQLQAHNVLTTDRQGLSQLQIPELGVASTLGQMVDPMTISNLESQEPTSSQVTELEEEFVMTLPLQPDIKLPPDSHHVQAPPDRPHTDTSGHSSEGAQPTKDHNVLTTDQQGLSQLQNPDLNVVSTSGQIMDQLTIPSLESQEPSLSQVMECEEEFAMTLPLQPDENPETVPADVPPPDLNQLQAHDVFATDQQEALGQLQNPELSVASTSGQMVDQTVIQSLESQEPTLSQEMELEEECSVTLPLQPDENPETAADILPPDPNQLQAHNVLTTDQQGLSQLQSPELGVASTLGQMVDPMTIPSLESQEPILSQVTERKEEFAVTLDEDSKTVASIPLPDPNQLQAQNVLAPDQQGLSQLQNPELGVALTSGQMVDQTIIPSLESQEPTSSQVMEHEEEFAVTLPLQPDKNPQTAADIPSPDLNQLQANIVLTTDQQEALSQLQNLELSMASQSGQMVDQTTIPSLESQKPTLGQVTEHEEDLAVALPLQPDENPETAASIPQTDPNQLQAHNVFATNQQEALSQLQNPELSVASTSGQIVDQTTIPGLESQEPTLSQVTEHEEDLAMTRPLQLDENSETAAGIPPADPNQLQLAPAAASSSPSHDEAEPTGEEVLCTSPFCCFAIVWRVKRRRQ